MDVVGIHRVVHTDMQRTNHHIGPIVVKNKVEHSMHTLHRSNILLDLARQFRGDFLAQQLVDRRGKHLKTSLYNQN